MKEKDAYIDDLISKLLTEGLREEERLKLDAWMAQSDENRRYVMECQEIWFSAVDASESERYDAGQAYKTFCYRIADSQRKKQKRIRLWKVFSQCAAVAAIVLIAVFSYRYGGMNLQQSLTDIEVEVPLGAQSKIRLPDGTLVMLNAGSRIHYPQDFGVDNRKVELEGEGYFEVKQDSEKPFYVYSENLSVKVLGTKFNFRDYPEDEIAVVSLLEGKVGLDNLLRQEAEITLLPDERVVLDKRVGQMKVETVKQIAMDSQWKDGKLSFDEMLLPEVATILERSYNVHIRLATDSLLGYRFYGSFNRTEQNIKDVLEVLKATRKMNYVLKGNEIVLY